VILANYEKGVKICDEFDSGELNKAAMVCFGKAAKRCVKGVKRV